ncbi:putative peptide/nitrate transporter At3g43790 [Silene latifolia]|uniref:putative peptide/nitrate transporter At3g43790 n=1 Tax=Silene latifolia TaxID=37657 RepID=UPI003D786B77
MEEYNAHKQKELFLYPQIDKIFGPVMIVRLCGMLSIPLLQCYPFVALLSGLSLDVVLNSAYVIKNVISTGIRTNSFILRNRAVIKINKEQLATSP